VRGLPPVPDDIAHLIAGLENDGALASIGFWIQVPGLSTAVPTDVATLFDLLITAVQELVNPLTAVSVSVATCRLVAAGTAPFSLLQHASPNAGAWSSGGPTQTASGIHWQTTVGGPRGQSITHVPWVPDQFTDDHLRLNDTGFDNVASEASAFLALVSSYVVGTMAGLHVGTLYRQLNGAPLGSALFAPFFYAVPVPVITTIRRRMRQAR
jgi:hypothetical protein